jgi:hypothetical protein
VASPVPAMSSASPPSCRTCRHRKHLCVRELRQFKS